MCVHKEISFGTHESKYGIHLCSSTLDKRSLVVILHNMFRVCTSDSYHLKVRGRTFHLRCPINQWSAFSVRAVSDFDSQLWVRGAQAMFLIYTVKWGWPRVHDLCLFPFSCSTSIKYAHAGQTDGSRLLVICDVALGKCMDLFKKDFSLTEAPPGYDSVHGVSKTASVPTDFQVFWEGRHTDPGLQVSGQALT